MLRPHTRMILSLPNNPFKPLVCQCACTTTSAYVDYTCNPDDIHLIPLTTLFSGNSTSTSSLSSLDQHANEICATALADLRRTFALECATRLMSEFGGAVVLWPMQQSPVFFDLVKHDNPKALIVLAFYCVLLKRSEDKWYLNGQGKKLLANIRRRLHYGWDRWIAWPLHELGLESSFTLGDTTILQAPASRIDSGQ